MNKKLPPTESSIIYNKYNSYDNTKTFIPYGRQSIDENDIAEVCSVLRSDWLTTGPKVNEFEQVVANYVGTKYGVAVNSGTAALHTAMFAIDIKEGDEVILPPMTFAATANCIVYLKATPVFTDIDSETLLIDPEKVEKKITDKTKAIIAVDYAGQPCDYDALYKISKKYGLALIADACHSLGAEYKGKKAGALADVSCFSFHPVKHISTGEGGMAVTNNNEIAERMRLFRNHGIKSDFKQRERLGSWFYEMTDLGYNYRISDIQCALGISQLRKLPNFLARRREIALIYTKTFSKLKDIKPIVIRDDVTHAFHLYIIQLPKNKRNLAFEYLRKNKIGVNVHYIPVHLHPFYRNNMGTGPGLCPVAENVYEKILSLPMFPSMTDKEISRVITSVLNFC